MRSSEKGGGDNYIVGHRSQWRLLAVSLFGHAVMLYDLLGTFYQELLCTSLKVHITRETRYKDYELHWLDDSTFTKARRWSLPCVCQMSTLRSALEERMAVLSSKLPVASGWCSFSCVFYETKTAGNIRSRWETRFPCSSTQIRDVSIEK